MARDISHLEPADRDPAQLRRTGLIITAIMIAGGLFVTFAFVLKLRADAKDVRPHIVGRLTEKFGGRDQNNKAFTTDQLRDKISFIQTKPKSGRYFWLFSLLDRLLLNRVFVTDEFHKVVRVKGQCSFFTYRDD